MDGLLFTAEEYREHLRRLLNLPLVACEYWELGHLDFGGSSEETAWVVRGGGWAFESALHFFVNALRFANAGIFLLDNGRDDPASEVFTPYAQAKMSELNQDGFLRFARQNVPPAWNVRTWPVHSSVRFHQAQQIEADWNDIAAIARFEGAYAALFWSTTA